MCLSYTKSQPQFAEANVLTTIPNWSRGTQNLEHFADFSKNVRFGRLNKVADEEYFRTLKDFQTGKIKSENDSSSDKENVVELPEAIVEAFYKQVVEEKHNSDLALSPQTERQSRSGKKRRSKSNQLENGVVDRLYMSPSVVV